MGRKTSSAKKKTSARTEKKRGGKKNFQYTEESMLHAVDDVLKGKSISQAAREAGVPRVTLHYKARGKRPLIRKMGPETVLTQEEEERIVDWVFVSCRKGFPVCKDNLLDSVKRLIEETKRENNFTANRPGRSWFESFLKRHPGVKERIPQNLTSSRSDVTSSDLIKWSASIMKYLSENDQTEVLRDPTRLFNGDETAFFLNPKGSAVLAPRGDKTVYQTVNSDEKECLTVLVTASAAGVMAPTLVVFKYERIPIDIATSVSTNWAIGKSDSGWMNGALFYEYITNSFYPWLVEKHIELPVIFFLDGHVSHLNLQTAQFCHDHGIILIALYPNATHLLQPMDVAVFRSLKGVWREKVHNWRLAHLANPTLKKRDFSPLLYEVLEQMDPQIVSNGFRKCGLYPWNVEEPIKSLKKKEESSPMYVPRNVQPSSVKHAHATEVVEKYLGSSKLKLFQAYRAKGNVPFQDQALFDLWKAITSPADILLTPIEQDEETPPHADNTCNPEETAALTISSPDHFDSRIEPIQETPQSASPVTPILMQHGSNHKEPQSKNTLPATEPHENTANLPSPFKRAFVYPEPGISSKSKNRRMREQFPSVISSKAWREYHEKKEKQKKEKESQKNERALERQRKKMEKEELQKKKKAEREQKKKKGAPPTTRGRATRNKKTHPPPPSSSESEEWRSSDNDMDVDEVAEAAEDVSENDSLTPKIDSWQEGTEIIDTIDDEQHILTQFRGENTTLINIDIKTGPSANSFFETTNTVFCNEDNGLIESIFNIDGLDVDANEFTVHMSNSEDVSGKEKTLVVESAGRKELEEAQDVPIIEVCSGEKEEGRAAEVKDFQVNKKTESDVTNVKKTPSSLELVEGKEGKSRLGVMKMEEEENEPIFLEGQFIKARFKKKNGVVEHICKIEKILADGCDVVLLEKISRIGDIYKENVRARIKIDQVVNVLHKPRRFASNFQFLPSDL